MCWDCLKKNYGEFQSVIQSKAEKLVEVIQILERWNIVLGGRSSVAGK